MKKLAYFFLLMGLPCVVFTSCGGDDDDDGGNSSYNADAAVLTNDDGDKLLITQVGECYYEYDDDGNLIYFDDGEDEWEVTSNPFRATTSYEGSYYSYDITMTMSTNGNGYITRVVIENQETSDYYDEYYSDNVTATISYDGSNQITKISYSGSGKEVNDGESWTETWSGSHTYTWSDNGKLTKIVVAESWKDSDGCSGTENDTYDFTYNNNGYTNPCRQHTPSTTGGMDEEIFALAFIGLLGVGPTYLPTYMEDEYDDYDVEEGEVYSGSEEEYYKYGYNSDGTIYYCAISYGGSYYDYAYFSYDEYTRAAKEQQTISEEQRLQKRLSGSMFHMSKARSKRLAARATAKD